MLTSKKTFMYDHVYLHKNVLYTVPGKYSTLNLPHAIFIFFSLSFWGGVTAKSVNVPSKKTKKKLDMLQKFYFLQKSKFGPLPTPLKDNKQKICNVF